MLLEGVEDREHLVVMDVGAGTGSTVEFFAQYNTCIHFLDLFSCPLLVDPPEEVDDELAFTAFSEYLDLPTDLKFDICLFWDALHRVDLPVLRGLSRALRPHLGRGTQGYAFGTLHAKAFDQSRYGIFDLEHLDVRPTVADGRFFAHTQQQLAEQFASFSIQRGTLLREGRLELLLEAI